MKRDAEKNKPPKTFLIKSVILALAKELYKARYYRAAFWLYTLYLKKDARCFEACVELGNTAMKLGQNTKAVSAYRQALEIKPNKVAVCFELGRAFFREGNYSEAEAMFLRALEGTRALAESNLFLSKILRLSKRLKEAQHHAEISLALDPGYTTYLELARISHLLDDSERVERLVVKLIESSETSDACAFYEVARFYREIGAYTKSLEFIKKASVIAPARQDFSSFMRLVRGDLAVYSRKFRPQIKSIPLKRKRTKHVLYFLETSLPDGTSGYAYRSHYLLKSQQKSGYNPIAVTRPGFGSGRRRGSFRRDIVDGVCYYRISTRGSSNYNEHPLDLYLQEYAFSASKLAKTKDVELIHSASNFKNGMAAAAVADAHNIPFVYELRGLWEDTQVAKGAIAPDSERYFFHRTMENYCLKRADAVITISEALKSEISERGIDSRKIFVLPNAVDTDRFPVLERDEELARLMGIYDSPTLGYISSFNAYEGLDLLLRAFALIIKQRPEVKLLLVGDGEEMEALRALARELDIIDSVIFSGRVAHDFVIRYYSLIDIFVVPRRASRVCEIVTPLKPYEAMSSGRAVVVSDLPALREMIIDGETGLSFKAGSAASLAQISIALLSSQELRSKLGTQGAKWVRNNRRWEHVISSCFAAYKFSKRKFNQ